MQHQCNGKFQRHCNGKILDLESDLTSEQQSDQLDLSEGQSILLVFILVRSLVNLQVTNFQLQLVGNYREPKPRNRGELKMKNVIQKNVLHLRQSHGVPWDVFIWGVMHDYFPI